jgi:uncharacterized coiled-coil protein SlyX
MSDVIAWSNEVARLKAEIARLRGHVAHRDKEIARLDALVVRLRAENDKLLAALKELAEEMEGTNRDSPQSMRMSIPGWAKRARNAVTETDSKT